MSFRRGRCAIDRIVVAVFALAAHACAEDAPPPAVDAGVEPARVQLPCLTQLDLSCEPDYEPTYANIYEQTLRRRCMDCHGSEGAAFKIEPDLPAAMSALPKLVAGPNAVVIPGDPVCSALLIRLESLDRSIAMPPRVGRIGGGERCAIAKWIAAGAR